MPQLSVEENARRDAEAKREFEAGEGVSADEAFGWLHRRIDGAQAPMPKARKTSQSTDSAEKPAPLAGAGGAHREAMGG